jgi:hypothetical protein
MTPSPHESGVETAQESRKESATESATSSGKESATESVTSSGKESATESVTSSGKESATASVTSSGKESRWETELGSIQESKPETRFESPLDEAEARLPGKLMGIILGSVGGGLAVACALLGGSCWRKVGSPNNSEALTGEAMEGGKEDRVRDTSYAELAENSRSFSETPVVDGPPSKEGAGRGQEFHLRQCSGIPKATLGKVEPGVESPV